MDMEKKYEDELGEIAWDDHPDFFGIVVGEVYESHKYDTYYFSILQHYESGKFYRVDWCSRYLPDPDADGPSHSHSMCEVKPVCEVVTLWKEVK